MKQARRRSEEGISQRATNRNPNLNQPTARRTIMDPPITYMIAGEAVPVIGIGDQIEEIN